MKSSLARSNEQSRAAAVTLPTDAPDAVVARNEHGYYCVPRSSLHRPVSRTILDAHVWEPHTLELVCGTQPDGDIVHAGTFFGDFIPALSRSRDERARVWAFEPNRENYECARITVELNHLDNVRLNNAGLDEKSGTALLTTSDRLGLPAGGRSRLIPDRARAPGASSEEVNLMRIDDVVSGDRSVAAIQLDVEGHEREALTGAMATIARCRPLIVLEAPPRADWIETHLAPLGYRVDGAVERNTVLRSSPPPG